MTPSATRIIRSTEKKAEILSSFDSFILLQFIIIYNYFKCLIDFSNNNSIYYLSNKSSLFKLF